MSTDSKPLFTYTSLFVSELADLTFSRRGGAEGAVRIIAESLVVIDGAVVSADDAVNLLKMLIGIFHVDRQG